MNAETQTDQREARALLYIPGLNLGATSILNVFPPLAQLVQLLSYNIYKVGGSPTIQTCTLEWDRFSQF